MKNRVDPSTRQANRKAGKRGPVASENRVDAEIEQQRDETRNASARAPSAVSGTGRARRASADGESKAASDLRVGREHRPAATQKHRVVPAQKWGVPYVIISQFPENL